MQTAAIRTSRRHFLIGSAGLAVAIAMPLRMAAASTGEVDELVKAVAGGKPVQDGKITLELPTIAENGLVVPLNFSVDSPMTDSDYVKSVHFYADGNPNPQLATYSFTPLSPKAAAQLRIRLAKTQTITAIAVMSNGDVYSAKQEVKVTIGGCGG